MRRLEEIDDSLREITPIHRDLSVLELRHWAIVGILSEKSLTRMIF